MATGVPVANNEVENHLTDEQLKDRTASLLAAAEQVSLQLQIQNKHLSDTIARFDRDFVRPLREGLHHDES